jgi:hypothetical protein
MFRLERFFKFGIEEVLLVQCRFQLCKDCPAVQIGHTLIFSPATSCCSATAAVVVTASKTSFFPHAQDYLKTAVCTFAKVHSTMERLRFHFVSELLLGL